ncbi:MAG: alpha-galactosidase [Oscillibacter sp.]|nr:alpha-galactosidase [Oscillibacter sp.]
MILCHKGLFTLHTNHTTYQMKADAHGVLLHTYYGPRVEGCDLSYTIRYVDRGFSPVPEEAGEDRTFSLDVLPQEYSGCGTGDFRLPSLDLELPNGSRGADLRFKSFRVERGKYALEGLPAFRGEEDETLTVVLEDAAAGVEVELLYGVLEDYDLITRAVRVINRGTSAVKIRQAASLCLDFQRGNLDLITFDGKHVLERCPNRGPLLPGVRSADSVRGGSSHQHNPFVILCDHSAGEDHGLCFAACLLYSGNFQAAAERSQFETVRLTLGIHPWNFCWTLGPGEAFTTPEAALCCSGQGFTPLTHRLHRCFRERLLRDPWGERPVLINNWESTEFSFDAERLVAIAKSAAPMGVGLFVMDDGWFGARDSDRAGLGDWTVNRDKLPGGLEALVPRIKALGMDFGLWVEPEMVNEDSELYRAHPDWVLQAPGRMVRSRQQLVLDFTRRDVRDHIYGALKAVLSSAEISYVKWDVNRSLAAVWSAALPPERQGEVFHRYILGVYDMLERMRRDFPHLLIEGCSGGGGRFDAGMLYYTPQIWCSDNTDAIDRLRIQYGTSFCYPVCTMGAHVSAIPNAQTGRSVSMETRGVVAMHGTFGYEMDPSRITPEEREVIRRQIAFFKKHQALIHQGDYYRLSDPFQNGPYTAWEQVSPDKREALVFVVSGPAQGGPPLLNLRLKGLEPSFRYQVDGQGDYPGAALMEAGWPLPMPWGDFQSWQFYLSAL